MNKRDAYIEKAQAKIEEYNARLDVLKAKAKGEIASQKITANEQIDKLDEKLNAAKKQLAKLTDSAGDAWEEFSGRFEELADDLGASIKKFIDRHR